MQTFLSKSKLEQVSVCKTTMRQTRCGLFSWAPCTEHSRQQFITAWLPYASETEGCFGGVWVGVRGSHPSADYSHTSSSSVAAHHRPPIEQRWLCSGSVGRSQFVWDRWALNNNSGRSSGQFRDWWWSSRKATELFAAADVRVSNIPSVWMGVGWGNKTPSVLVEL